MTIGPPMNNGRDYHGCGIYHSGVHSGRPVIVTAGSFDGVGKKSSEIWDFTVPGSQWQFSKYWEKTENTLNLKGYANDSICSSFNQYFFLFQAEPLLIEMRNGAKMSTTAQGEGLIMTYGKGVYSFKCTSEISCKWSKESFNLQISRQDHAMLPVPMSFLENCGWNKL